MIPTDRISGALGGVVPGMAVGLALEAWERNMLLRAAHPATGIADAETHRALAEVQDVETEDPSLLLQERARVLRDDAETLTRASAILRRIGLGAGASMRQGAEALREAAERLTLNGQ